MFKVKNLIKNAISGCGKILNYNGLMQMELISLQRDLKSETC